MNKITKRDIIAFSLLLLMCILSGVILYRMEYAWHQEKELRQDRIKLNSVAEMMDRVDETREAAAQFLRNADAEQPSLHDADAEGRPHVGRQLYRPAALYGRRGG